MTDSEIFDFYKSYNDIIEKELVIRMYLRYKQAHKLRKASEAGYAKRKLTDKQYQQFLFMSGYEPRPPKQTNTKMGKLTRISILSNLMRGESVPVENVNTDKTICAKLSTISDMILIIENGRVKRIR